MAVEPPAKQDVSATAGAARLSLSGNVTTARAFGRLPETHEAYALIGRAAAMWAYLDHTLDSIIWSLVGADNAKIACVTGRLSSPAQRCDAILGLCKLCVMPEDISRTVKKIRNDCHDVGEARHRLAHDPTFVDQPTGEVGQFRSMPRSNLKFGMVNIDIKTINDDIAKLSDVIDRADRLRAEIWGRLGASRGKSPQQAP